MPCLWCSRGWFTARNELCKVKEWFHTPHKLAALPSYRIILCLFLLPIVRLNTLFLSRFYGDLRRLCSRQLLGTAPLADPRHPIFPPCDTPVAQRRHRLWIDLVLLRAHQAYWIAQFTNNNGSSTRRQAFS